MGAIVLPAPAPGASGVMVAMMSSDEYEELYLASVRVPLVLAVFLGLWGLVILVLQALQIDFSSVLRKASGAVWAKLPSRWKETLGKIGSVM